MNKFLIRGLGFFNDAYDLFVMNVVNIVLTEQYGKHVYTAHMKSSVSAAALIGAVIGQLLFGYLGDVFGRKVNMIITCCLLIFGGILCTCAYGGSGTNTLWFLVIARGLLGVGIGGEYPLAAASTAEDATSVPDRNRRVALTFSLQGVGSLTASILGNLLVQALADGPKGTNSKERLEIVWRLLFGLGVIPACIVCYYRITAEETEAFKATQAKNQVQTSSTGTPSAIGAGKRARLAFILKNYGRGLLGCAGTWFLFDIVFYAQNLFSASILSVIGVSNASLQVVTTQNAFVALMALPGYYVAVYFINSMGRRVIQLQGFAAMTILFLCLAIFWDDLKKRAVLFIIVYGLALFFSNFGPNTSTFVMPTEMFPTQIRSTCHGFSAAMGKAGAAIGSFGFSIWVEHESYGYMGAFYTFAAITFVSIPLTYFCMFDNEQGFEEMDAEFAAKLHGVDEFTRESFAEQHRLSSAADGVHKSAKYDGMATPPIHSAV
uniref:Major facilitator superfamily (MFS) profile domain-containing protein n=1 Tax=Globisporangium ultimum (strain ATCC 200006 / CBS 805.95 / DAOM BR144) TaxID=431595 RepID=K3WG08_GLOUD